MRATLANNIAWLVLLALVGRASWFITLLLIARAVGAASYGELSFYLAAWVIVGRAAGLGLDVWVNRYIARSDSQTERAAASAAALTLRLALVGAAVGVIVLLAFWLRPTILTALLLFALLGLRQLAESLREALVGIYQGHERMREQALAFLPWEIAQLAATVLLIYGFAVTDPALLVGLVVAFSFAKVAALTAGLAVIDCRPWRAGVPGRPALRRALREAVQLGAVVLLALAIGKIDVLLLRGLGDAATVGNYALAYLFIEAVDVLLGTVRQALFPRLAWFAKTDRARFRRLVLRGAAFFVIMASAVSAAVWLLQESLFYWLLGDSYPRAWGYLPWLSLALPFLSLAGALGNANISFGNQSAVMRLQLLGLTFNVVLNLILIPFYGGFGAVFTTLLTYLLMVAGHSRILLTRLAGNGISSNRG